MSLRTLNIVFSSNEDFMANLKSAVFESKSSVDMAGSLSFDSVDTYNKVTSYNGHCSFEARVNKSVS